MGLAVFMHTSVTDGWINTFQQYSHHVHTMPHVYTSAKDKKTAVDAAQPHVIMPVDH